MAEEVHWARVRAAVAAAALRKGGRARAVVQAVRVAGGGGTIGNGSRAFDGATFGPKMATTPPAKSVKAWRGRILRAFAV